MILTPPDTPFFLRNGNADTIAAKFLQHPAPAYRREMLPDSTGKTKTAYDFQAAFRPMRRWSCCFTVWKEAAAAITRPN